eukprot:scaffold8631_cov108-Isochrysis_galbana.AAC.4
MIDSPTDTALTKGRERSAPGMSHADTHTSPRPYRRRAFRQGTLRQSTSCSREGFLKCLRSEVLPTANCQAVSVCSRTNIAVEFPVREVAISDELHNAQSNLNDLSRKK